MKILYQLRTILLHFLIALQYSYLEINMIHLFFDMILLDLILPILNEIQIVIMIYCYLYILSFFMMFRPVQI